MSLHRQFICAFVNGRCGQCGCTEIKYDYETIDDWASFMDDRHEFACTNCGTTKAVSSDEIELAYQLEWTHR